MAKISKAVREKRKDFSKTKLKVGKTKQLPANHTETSFRSKAVVLPKQSITTEPSVKESQSLQHYLALLSHKSGDIRKDALQQMNSYLISSPPLLSTVITPLMAVVIPLMIDDSSAVRRLLLELFSTVLSKLPRQVLSSHRNNLLLYISSAMTHISPSIRADSTRFLMWTMTYTTATAYIISTQLSKFLDTFATLFGWSSQAASVVSNKALLSHLTVFETLLDAALTHLNQETTSSTTFTVPLTIADEIFIPQRTTAALLKPCESLNLWAPETSQLNADLSTYHVIEPHLSHLLKFLGNRFTDSINGDRSLCLPTLQLLNTLARSAEVKEHKMKELKSVTKTIQNGMDKLQETSTGRGADQSLVQGLTGLWRNIQEEME